MANLEVIHIPEDTQHTIMVTEVIEERTSLLPSDPIQSTSTERNQRNAGRAPPTVSLIRAAVGMTVIEITAASTYLDTHRIGTNVSRGTEATTQKVTARVG